jgi:hypothetical protein
VFAEEFVVVDGDARLFQALRPLVDIALRLDQNDDGYCWHGWNRGQIDGFLASLPSTCSLVVGVWEGAREDGVGGILERERLVLGCVCEVSEGEVKSIRTFEALAEAGLRSVDQLEPGIDDALEIMRAARKIIAPAAYALFMVREAWDEWLLTPGDDGGLIDKGELLASIARQGRCVLMGSQFNR